MQLYIQIEGDALVCIQRLFTIQDLFPHPFCARNFLITIGPISIIFFKVIASEHYS